MRRIGNVGADRPSGGTWRDNRFAPAAQQPGSPFRPRSIARRTLPEALASSMNFGT